jgi:hypothetical protein
MSMKKTSNQNDFEELWTVGDIAAHYKVCGKTVRRRLVELEVPTVRIGRQIRVRASHVQLLAKKKW